MSSLQLNSYGLAPFQAPTTKSLRPSRHVISSSPTKLKIRAISTAPESTSEAKEPEEPPCVHLAFVHSVLLPDGTPDVHFRNAPGAQKLRDIMLDTNIELYGPYSRALLNCGGGGTRIRPLLMTILALISGHVSCLKVEAEVSSAKQYVMITPTSQLKFARSVAGPINIIPWSLVVEGEILKIS